MCFVSAAEIVDGHANTGGFTMQTSRVITQKRNKYYGEGTVFRRLWVSYR